MCWETIFIGVILMNSMEHIRSEFDNLIEDTLNLYVNDLSEKEGVIYHIGEIIESCYRNFGFEQGEVSRLGAEILIPKILERKNKSSTHERVEIEKIIEAIVFSAEYRNYRDIIFYSYNDPDSISWRKINNKFEIRNSDRSIVRQLAAETYSSAFNSIGMSDKIYSGNNENIEDLLRGSKSFDYKNENVVKAIEYISNELAIKIDSFFSYVNHESNISFGEYSYNEFFSIYNMLMFYALYERHNAKANNLAGVVIYTEEELLYAVETNIGIERKKSKKILSDISLASRSTFVKIQDKSKYYLFPTAFSLLDGISSNLKLFAKRDSDAFSERFAAIIGNGLVEEVESEFKKFRNFKTIKDLKLNSYDNTLPDIDLVAISYEPSLGFHFFISEVKNNLPATWAKEYLKSTGKKGFITKALSQVNKVQEFLDSEKGKLLLCELAIKEFSHLDTKKLFPKGFLVHSHQLIISSQSMGLFFSEEKANIIEGDLLRHIIRASDGDVNYILFHLRELDNIIDECVDDFDSTYKVGNFDIVNSDFKLKKHFRLAEHKYLSNGTFEEIERMSLQSGYTFVDYLNLSLEK